MKTILIALSLLVSTSAFAYHKCEVKVSRSFQNYTESKGYQFVGIEEMDQDGAFHYVTESNMLSKKEEASALKAIERDDVVLYIGTDNYMSGTGMALLVVDQKSCRILKQYSVYSE